MASLFLKNLGNTSVRLKDGNGNSIVGPGKEVELKKKTQSEKRKALQIRFFPKGGKIEIQTSKRWICVAESNGVKFTQLSVRERPKRPLGTGKVPRRYKATKTVSGALLCKGSWRIAIQLS